MHLLEACDIADTHFVLGIEEAFARHIRAIERRLSDADRDFTGITVIFEPQLPSSVARIFAQVRRSIEDPERLLRDPNAAPSLGCAKRLYILCGTAGKYRPGQRPTGAIDEAEWHHSEIQHRLVVAHELAHIALGHVFDEQRNLSVPEQGWGEDSPEEMRSRAYAAYLVKLSSEYMDRREWGRSHRNGEIRRAVEEMWPDWAQSQEGLKFLTWLFSAAD